MFLPMCWPFFRPLLGISKLKNIAPAHKSDISWSFRIPFGRLGFKNTLENTAPADKSTICKGFRSHFGSLGLENTFENTAPADKSGSNRFENTAPVDKSTLRFFHGHSKTPRLCTNPSFEALSKSLGRSQAPFENTAPADKSTTAEPLSSHCHQNCSETPHLCTNLCFEVASLKVQGSKTPHLCTNPIFCSSKLRDYRQIRSSRIRKHSTSEQI